MRSVLLSTRHSPIDARLDRWSHRLGLAGRHDRYFLRSIDGVVQGRIVFLRKSWRALRSADVWVLPDPTLHLLYPLIRLVRRSAVVVLDVHEDYRLTAEIRPGRWPWLTRCLIWGCCRSYRTAQQRGDRVVIAAEVIDLEGADLFDNCNDTPDFPTPLPPIDRAVYVGDLTVERGAREVLSLAQVMPEIHIDLVGRTSVSDDVKDGLQAAPNITVHGELPFDEAIKVAAGCGIGLSLLQDSPPYREAQASKLFDYASLGQFLIVTPLPGQARLVQEHDIGLVLNSFHVDDDTAAQIRAVTGSIDPDQRAQVAERARACHLSRLAVIDAQWRDLRTAIEDTVDSRS